MRISPLQSLIENGSTRINGELIKALTSNMFIDDKKVVSDHRLIEE